MMNDDAPTQESDDLPEVDLSFVDRAEARLEEVSAVTKFKAPELMHLFNYGQLMAAKAKATLSARHQSALAQSEALAADISLNRAPALLLSKGLTTARSPAGSEDLRKSVVAADPEYIALQKRINDLKAGVEYFSIRAKTLERAFSAVKAIYGDSQWMPNPTLNNGAPPPRENRNPQAEAGRGNSAYNGFGGARI